MFEMNSNETNTKELLEMSTKRMRQIADTYAYSESEYNGRMPTSDEVDKMTEALTLFTHIEITDLFDEANKVNGKVALDILTLEIKRRNGDIDMEALVDIIRIITIVVALNWFFEGYFVKEIQEELVSA